jgi:hypothetical protein
MSHVEQTSGVNKVLREFGLVDAHSFTHPTSTAPATHCNGSVQIDFVFVSPDLLPSIKATSILALHQGYTSDHRALIVDFDPKISFGSNMSEIEKQTRRKLISTNPRAMEKYVMNTRKTFQSNKHRSTSSSVKTNHGKRKKGHREDYRGIPHP